MTSQLICLNSLEKGNLSLKHLIYKEGPIVHIKYYLNKVEPHILFRSYIDKKA